MIRTVLHTLEPESVNEKPGFGLTHKASDATIFRPRPPRASAISHIVRLDHQKRLIGKENQDRNMLHRAMKGPASSLSFLALFLSIREVTKEWLELACTSHTYETIGDVPNRRRPDGCVCLRPRPIRRTHKQENGI